MHSLNMSDEIGFQTERFITKIALMSNRIVVSVEMLMKIPATAENFAATLDRALQF